jgi:hypothetical protein
MLFQHDGQPARAPTSLHGAEAILTHAGSQCTFVLLRGGRGSLHGLPAKDDFVASHDGVCGKGCCSMSIGECMKQLVCPA